jgi:hypothetical protein
VTYAGKAYVLIIQGWLIIAARGRAFAGGANESITAKILMAGSARDAKCNKSIKFDCKVFTSPAVLWVAELCHF